MAGPQLQRQIHAQPDGNRTTLAAQRQLVQESRVQIIDDTNQIDEQDDNIPKRVRHKHRPLYRRLLNYLRTAWTGVHFTSSAGKNTNRNL